MTCVCSHIFSPHGEIVPQRGLRQGDPISPYIFLFCANMLTQRLRQEEVKRNFKVLSISNFWPRVSHLLFVC